MVTITCTVIANGKAYSSDHIAIGNLIREIRTQSVTLILVILNWMQMYFQPLPCSLIFILVCLCTIVDVFVIIIISFYPLPLGAYSFSLDLFDMMCSYNYL